MNILFVDIETSPNLVYTFGLRNAFIAPEQIVEPTRVLCLAARWLDDDHTYFFSEWTMGHEQMIQTAHNLLSMADVVVHYNGEKFDERRLNQEFAQAGLAPPDPFQTVDLWRVINKRFDLPSQKLTYALKHFGLEDKFSTGGMRLWMSVLAGDKEAQRKMEEYNVQDVDIMLPLYRKLLPWIPGHPNVNLYQADGLGYSCPTCGSVDLHKRGYHYTRVSKFQRYKCNACGAWSHDGSRIEGAGLR